MREPPSEIDQVRQLLKIQRRRARLPELAALPNQTKVAIFQIYSSSSFTYSFC